MNDQQLFYLQKLQFELDSWDLNDALSKNEKIIPVDARSVEAFENEHIPGAISLSHRTMNIESTSHLDKTILYVTYCHGIGCNASTKGAFNMVKLGFQVKELIGGIDCWKKDGYKTEGVGLTSKEQIACGC